MDRFTLGEGMLNRLEGEVTGGCPPPRLLTFLKGGKPVKRAIDLYPVIADSRPVRPERLA